MSKSTRETVACPNCGHEDEVVIWSSLNNMISPNEANELLFGNLFGYACTECGNATELCYVPLPRHGEACDGAVRASRKTSRGYHRTSE